MVLGTSMTLPTLGQIDVAKCLQGGVALLQKPSDYLPIEVKWDMKGEVQVAVNEGLNYLQEGNPQQSILHFTRSLQLDSSLWVSYYYRGICFKSLFRLKEAERDLITACRLHSGLAEAQVELGEVYGLQKLLLKARECFNNAVKTNPSLVQGYFALGIIEPDKRKALNFFVQCNEVNPHFAPAYVAQAMIVFKEDDNRSLDLLNHALQVDPSYVPAYFWRGLKYESLHQLQKSMEDWNRSVSFNPGNPFFLMMRGFLYLELGNFDNAFSDLRKALLAQEVSRDKFTGGQTALDKRIDIQAAALYFIKNGYGLQESSFGLLKKAFCFLLIDKNKSAISAITKAEWFEPSATAYYLMAIAYENLNRHDSAFIFYDKALRLDNDIFDAHKKRSIYRYELKDWKGSYADLDEMIRILPGSGVPYRLKGMIKFQQGDYEGSVVDLTRFLKTDSVDADALRERGVAFFKLGKRPEAMADFSNLLYLEPKNFSLYSDVVKNYLFLGDTLHAVGILKRYASHLKQYPPHLVLAKILVNLKKDDLARIEVDSVAALVKSSNQAIPEIDSDIRYLEGRIDLNHGAYDDAIKKFNNALRIFPGNLTARYFRAKAYLYQGHAKKALDDLEMLQASGYPDPENLYNRLSKNK
jgi:tetratricopeptide (TPR) repeat protein